MGVNMRFLVLLLLLLTNVVEAGDEEKLKKDLISRCKATFEIIKNNELKSFVALMPGKPGEDEKKYIKKILDSKHQKWIVKGGGIKKLEAIGVSFNKPVSDKVVRFSAVAEAKVNLKVSAKNLAEESMCKFLRVKQGWYLSRLP